MIHLTECPSLRTGAYGTGPCTCEAPSSEYVGTVTRGVTFEMILRRPPLQCGRCGRERWNDESVTWLPLRGLYRHPYCAVFCADEVMRPRNPDYQPRHLIEWEQSCADPRTPSAEPPQAGGSPADELRPDPQDDW